MKRFRTLIFPVIVFSLLVFSCDKNDEYNEPNNNQEDDENQKQALEPLDLKEWTFLFYDDADFSNAYDPIMDLASRVASDSSINYLVLRDRNYFEAEYYYIEEDHNYSKIESIGEANMGSAVTLDNFIKFAHEFFPANRYIIAFYDHGGGWKGACWDVSNMNDNLTCVEMDEAFTLNGGMDMVLFTAPCLMGAVETAYQVRNSSDVYIGSENVSGFIIWKDILQEFDTIIKINPLIGTTSLAEEIIRLHSENIEVSEYGSTLTMSAIDVSKTDLLVARFEQVISYYVNNFEDFSTFPLAGIRKFYSNHYDLKDFLSFLLKHESNDSIKGLIDNTISCFDDCIIAECHGDSVYPINGLSIYFPDSLFSTQIYYSNYGTNLNFKNDCSWGGLVLMALKNTFSEVSLNPDMEILSRDTYYPDN